MKRYLINICEPRDSYNYVTVEQALLKNHAIRMSDDLFLLQVQNERLRIDDVVFAISQERKSDVIVVEIDLKTCISWNFNDSKKLQQISDFYNEQ